MKHILLQSLSTCGATLAIAGIMLGCIYLFLSTLATVAEKAC